MKTAILIPAYKPEKTLFLPFLKELAESFENIVIINDGSGTEFDSVFEECEKYTNHVLHHYINKGKGSALKSGIGYIMNRMPEIDGIITADCDGQHSVTDIKKVANELEEHPEDLIIGGRRFDENVPFRSQLGNSVTRGLFKLSTGLKIYDTQTGLRGFAREYFEVMSRLNGERYEYEMNMLLKLRELGIKPREIEIKTIYINENATSHYNAVKDSLRIASRLFLFASGSIMSFVVDYLFFSLFTFVCMFSYGMSFFFARVISAVVNYLINRKIVFGGNCSRSAVVKYAVLATAVMLGGVGVMKLAENYALSHAVFVSFPVVVKAVYDIIMYFVNYIIQRDFVFKVKKKGK